MRSVASLMGPSTSESIAIRLMNNGNKFLTHSSRIIVSGYRKVWSVADDEEGSSEHVDFSKYKIGDKFKL
jgi:DNA topoisomerase IA